MWLFGENGVQAYSPDGKELKNSISSENLCDKKEDHVGPSYMYCRFFDIVSDGKKYVWAAINRHEPRINVFDIDTASLVGSFTTCEDPNSLEYHSLRDEVWVRCNDIEDANSTLATHLDVFSASSPSVDLQTNILTKDRALSEGLSSNGYSVVDYTLGDIGYLTDSDLPHLFKVDLSSKAIIETIEMGDPKPHGLYEAIYSPMNKHIFVRAHVCCSCGFDGADMESCGTKTPTDVTLTTGNFP